MDDVNCIRSLSNIKFSLSWEEDPERLLCSTIVELATISSSVYSSEPSVPYFSATVCLKGVNEYST